MMQTYLSDLPPVPFPAHICGDWLKTQLYAIRHPQPMAEHLKPTRRGGTGGSTESELTRKCLEIVSQGGWWNSAMVCDELKMPQKEVDLAGRFKYQIRKGTLEGRKDSKGHWKYRLI